MDRYASEYEGPPREPRLWERWTSQLPEDWLSSVGEWVGFGLILTTVFVLPRRRAMTHEQTPTKGL